LRRRMREQVLLNMTRGVYQKVTLALLAEELSLSVPDVKSTLDDMILDRRLSAQIEQWQIDQIHFDGREGSPIN